MPSLAAQRNRLVSSLFSFELVMARAPAGTVAKDPLQGAKFSLCSLIPLRSH